MNLVLTTPSFPGMKVQVVNFHPCGSMGNPVAMKSPGFQLSQKLQGGLKGFFPSWVSHPLSDLMQSCFASLGSHLEMESKHFPQASSGALMFKWKHTYIGTM